VFLLVVSLSVLLLFAGTAVVEHLMQAEMIAEALAPKMGADEDVVRTHLQEILGRGAIRRIIFYCAPCAILSLLVTTKLIVENRTQRGSTR